MPYEATRERLFEKANGAILSVAALHDLASAAAGAAERVASC